MSSNSVVASTKYLISYLPLFPSWSLSLPFFITNTFGQAAAIDVGARMYGLPEGGKERVRLEEKYKEAIAACAAATVLLEENVRVVRDAEAKEEETAAQLVQAKKDDASGASRDGGEGKDGGGDGSGGGGDDGGGDGGGNGGGDAGEGDGKDSGESDMGKSLVTVSAALKLRSKASTRKKTTAATLKFVMPNYWQRFLKAAQRQSMAGGQGGKNTKMSSRGLRNLILDMYLGRSKSEMAEVRAAASRANDQSGAASAASASSSSNVTTAAVLQKFTTEFMLHK